MRSVQDLSVALRSGPWALPPRYLYALAAQLDAGALTPSARPPRRSPAAAGRAGVAHIALTGLLVQRPGIVTQWGIGTSTEVVARSLALALADDEVESILLEFDSVGGEVYGVAELADKLFAARRVKPIIGAANSAASSGAYWLLSQCSEAWITPGGEVGGIGIAAQHSNMAGALSRQGVGMTLIAAGKYKTEGNPFGPLGTDALAHMQSRVDDYFAMFTRAVARGRGVLVDAVRCGMGQGRTVGATQAREQNMVDGIAPLGTIVDRMARRQFATRATAAASTRSLLARFARA